MREYAVVASNQTISAIATAVWVNPLAGYPVAIIRAYWGQSSTAVSAQQRVHLNLQASAFPTMTGVAPIKLNTSDPISLACVSGTGAAGTCGIVPTTEGGGTRTTVYSDSVNNLNGFLWVPSPIEVLRVNPINSLGFGLYFPAIPSSTAGHNAGVHYAEIA